MVYTECWSLILNYLLLPSAPKVEEGDIAKSSISVRGKKPITKKVMEYCYEPEMEEVMHFISLQHENLCEQIQLIACTVLAFQCLHSVVISVIFVADVGVGLLKQKILSPSIVSWHCNLV